MNSMLLRVVKRMIPFTEFVGDFADLADVLGAHKPRPPTPDGEHFVAGFGNVNQNTGFQDVMIEPFPVVFLMIGGQKLIIFWRSDIGYSVFHQVCYDRTAYLLTSYA